VKIILSVVSKAWNKNANINVENEEKNELSMNGKEDGGALCGMTINHTLDKCYNYDKSKSMDENRKLYTAKLEEKKKKLEENKKRRKERKATQATSEQSNSCLEKDAHLYCEPCFVMGLPMMPMMK
jgi:hypothetical protein